MHYGKLWLGLGLVVACSFAVLGYFGSEIYRQAPPVPERVVTTDGNVVFTGQEIKDGQNVWQSLGGQEVFWSINIGLALMVLISLLPVGMMQAWASVTHGMWYARSAEFLQTDLMDRLRWLRVVGDTIFAVGIVGLGWFVLGLKTGWSVTGGVTKATVQREPVRPDACGAAAHRVEYCRE
jgi:nitric oxide reductase large subunit